MTWIPVLAPNNHFQWTSSPSNSPKRHICPQCQGVMTIVYDGQPDCTWPCAGSLDEDCVPEDIHAHLSRVVHICCRWKPCWYDLPDDGMERLANAS